MYPYLFNTNIPTYTVMVILGGLASILVGEIFLIKKLNIKRFDSFLLIGFVIVFAYLGAVILSIITHLKSLLASSHSFIDWLTSGYVFYGGLIGGAFGIFLFCKIFKVDVKKHLDFAATTLPLGQVFGRLGCLCAGCCFGKVIPANIDFLGISFPINTDAYQMFGSQKLYPTQIFEMVYCLIIFVVLFSLIMLDKLKPGYASIIYLISYGICRFINEFFRGDFRGDTLFLSLSQYISLFLIGAAVIYLFINRQRKIKN